VKRSQAFPAEPGSVRGARVLAQEVLAGLDPALLELIVLMVSELVTNSILHARTDFTVEIDSAPDEVRITVSDAGPGDPSVRAPARDNATGRGLQIVERLADEWGVSEGSPGKSVWFVVRPETRARAGTSDGTAQSVPPRREVGPGPAREGQAQNSGRLALAA
jgi:anti-sigma regulatory factor (Ser/Thr protein kinase)